MNLQFEVKRSLKGQLKLIFYSIVFIATGIFILSFNIIGLLVIIISLYCLIIIIKQNRNPLLIINSEGIIELTSKYNIGFIPWNNIKDFAYRKTEINFLKENQLVEYIGINVIDEELFLNNLNDSQRNVILFNKKIYGVPIFISLDDTNCTYEKILEMMNEFCNKK